MKVSQIIGTDLSKRTIDFFCHLVQQHVVFENNLQGFKQFLKWMRQIGVDCAEVMIVMEHTGLYSYCFEEFLHQQKIAFTKVSARQIQRSIGLVRGKNDKVDARRIAEYGAQHLSKLQPCPKTSNQLKTLQLLHTTRERLVRQKAATICAMKELKNIGLKNTDPVMRVQVNVFNCLTREVAKLERQIKAVIDSDQELKKTNELITSVGGVGPVVATATIIKTGNFTRFANGRKFSCFCGTAPFEHSSGSSIKKRTRVSPLADRSMKTLFDQAAKSAIVHDPELRAFYHRRTEAGKPKMSTINIVRNKIIYRIFAVVKRGTPYQKLAA